MKFKPELLSYEILMPPEDRESWGVVVFYKDGDRELSCAMRITDNTRWGLIVEGFIPALVSQLQDLIERIVLEEPLNDV